MSKTISYLLSDYPTISHTFFLSEITHLKRLGFNIQSCSINDCDRSEDALTDLEKDEKSQTFYLKSSDIKTILGSHLRSLFSAPGRYLKALWYSASLADGLTRQLLYRLFYFVEAIVITDWMQRSGSSHLHIHFGSEVATVGLIAKKAAPITLSYTIHGSDEFYDVSEYHLEEKVKAADFIFCISSFTASQLMRLAQYEHWKKLIVAPLGVNTDKFHPTNKTNIKKALNILSVGRLTPAKGQHLLLHAVANLKTEHPNIKLTLVGDGEDRKSLEALAKQLKITQQIHFVGSVNQDHIVKFYQQADIFCLPSFAEGVPVVLMEAMAMEIPCITTRITGIPELIRNNKDGLLVKSGDIPSLQNAIQTLADSSQLRENLGKTARSRVKEKYQLNTNFDALGTHFEEQLSKLSQPKIAAIDEDEWSLQSHG